MKNKILLFTLISIFALSLSLTACGSNVEKNNTSSSTSQTSTLQNGNTDSTFQSTSRTSVGGDTLPEVFSEGLSYELISYGMEYAVVGIGSCTDLDIKIPSTYSNKPVTSIGVSAFNSCYSLTSIEIPSNVRSIGRDAFYYCMNLTSVKIPKSVRSIGDGAFYWCESLTDIIVEEGNITYKSIDGNLYSKDETMLLQYAVGKTDTSFVLPDSVTSIGERAFECCKALISIEIPSNVRSIGDSAFSYCLSLTDIIVEEGNIIYKSIDGNLYSKDETMLLQYAVGKTDTTFVFPNSVTSIGVSAFCCCDSLISIKIPAGVTSIGRNAFRGCDSLINVTFENDNGWFASESSTATNGKSIDVSDPTNNAIYVTDPGYNDYCKYLKKS